MSIAERNTAARIFKAEVKHEMDRDPCLSIAGAEVRVFNNNRSLRRSLDRCAPDEYVRLSQLAELQSAHGA